MEMLPLTSWLVWCQDERKLSLLKVVGREGWGGREGGHRLRWVDNEGVLTDIGFAIRTLSNWNEGDRRIGEQRGLMVMGWEKASRSLRKC